MRLLLLIAAALLSANSLPACNTKKGEKSGGPGDKASPGEASTDTGKPTAAPAPDASAMPTRPTVPAPPDVAAPGADAKKSAGGIPYKIVTPGKDGADSLAKNDIATMQLDVWTIKGETRQTTRAHNAPVSYPLGSIPMRGFAEGVVGMKVGEKRRIWVPADKGFTPGPGIPAEALTYDVELVGLKRAPNIAEKDLKPPADAKKGKDGWSWVVLTPGKGKKKPSVSDHAKIKMSEWTQEGRLLKSTFFRGEGAVQVDLQRAPPGLQMAMTDMTAGEKRRVWVPASLGYKNQPGIPEGPLVYEIEITEVIDRPTPPPAPADVKAPPDDAKKTTGGVRYKVLTPGKGDTHPKPENSVKVNYTGWTTDGKMFDSSITRGEPTTFKLGDLIAGWREGLQTMVAGEKARLWIPEELAYKGKSNGPQGMLVFDVELVEILK
jgi:FKBP-type peptidyl-prolyl cis-trans isomerase